MSPEAIAEAVREMGAAKGRKLYPTIPTVAEVTEKAVLEKVLAYTLDRLPQAEREAAYAYACRISGASVPRRVA